MDRRQRARERRFAETGDPNDGAMYLAARVRGGDITPGAITIAALFGDPAARLVQPDSPKPPDPGVPVAKLSKRSAVHGLRGAVSTRPSVGFPPVCYPRTFCGRPTKPGAKPDRPSGRPTCATCLRSDHWRNALMDSVGELAAKVADIDPAVGFRVGALAVDHVLDSHLIHTRDPENARRFAEYALWGSGGVVGRPPPPRDEPNAWNPAGLAEVGVAAWLYGLGCAALDLHDRAPSLPVTLRALMRTVMAAVHSSGEPQAGTINLLNILRETVVPYVLGTERDPLFGLAVLYRDRADRQAREELHDDHAA